MPGGIKTKKTTDNRTHDDNDPLVADGMTVVELGAPKQTRTPEMMV